jgi:Uma2 family endonuclease
MATVPIPSPEVWTAGDLIERFGPIPLARVRFRPVPGFATEKDVVEIHDHEDRLCELIDGILLEKTVGAYESYLATLIARLIGNFVTEHDLGILLGADGMIRLAPGLVRIPDVSFVSWKRLPGRRIPREPIADLVPDLAIEVISPGNTAKEIERKLTEYFDAGTPLVWYVYPMDREVRVFTSPQRGRKVQGSQTLRGGSVLPGFELPLEVLFAGPKARRTRNK